LASNKINQKINDLDKDEVTVPSNESDSPLVKIKMGQSFNDVMKIIALIGDPMIDPCFVQKIVRLTWRPDHECNWSGTILVGWSCGFCCDGVNMSVVRIIVDNGLFST
jgi:hypothetical protein